jgi:hypothetical protein
MRLTLRTMLAYMDNVLDPADAGILGQKIEESDFASGLLQRIRGVMHKLRLDAPKLDGKGMGNDANTVAEYLDSSLPQDRVGEFERVCLESDKHLCEVAACHQVLTLVLGKPANVPPNLRERVYALGDPARAVAHLPPVAVTAPVGHSGAPPVSKTNGQPAVEAPPPLEVPEYLRAGRQTGAWPLVAAGVGALAITLVALWLGGVIDGRRIAGIFRRGEGEPIAMVTDGAADVAKNHGSAAGEDSKAAPQDATANTAADSAGPAATPTVTAATEPASFTPVEPATTERTTIDSTEPRVAATAAAPIAAAADTDVPPAPATPPAAADSATPRPPEPKRIAVAPPAPQPIDVGRFTSDREVVATLDPDDGQWYRKQPQAVLTAGERLTVLPMYRPQIALPSAVQFTFVGEASLQMDEPAASGIPRVTVEYGRFVAATAGRAGAQVELDLAGVKGLVTLVDADTVLAIKVARWIPPGENPEEAPRITIVEMYNANGRATWQQVDRAKTEIPARHVHVYFGDDPPETHGPFLTPEWTDGKSARPIDREAATKLERMIDLERPLSVSLQEMTRDRAVRSLAARCLAALDDYELILREMADGDQYSFWNGEFDALRHAIARSEESAAKIREATGLLRAADARSLYRLLWGYSEQQLEQGAAKELVDFLEHDATDVRVLAHQNLSAITGAPTLYRPEKPPAQSKTSIQTWRDRLKKGAIIYSFPPSPLDIYKPAPAPATTPATAPK